MNNRERVAEFHRAFNQIDPIKPGFPSAEVRKLRMDLIEEELDELKKAEAENNIVEVADALTDLLYVIEGMGLRYGINLEACFKEVHASNMSKLGEDGKPVLREDGKILKGKNYWKPDLAKVLSENDNTFLPSND